MLTENRFSIAIKRLFTKEEFAKLTHGFIGDQDSKWFIYYDEPWLLIYRGNREFGSCYFALRFEFKHSSFHVAEAWGSNTWPREKNEASNIILEILDDRFELRLLKSNIGAISIWLNSDQDKIFISSNPSELPAELSKSQSLELAQTLIIKSQNLK